MQVLAIAAAWVAAGLVAGVVMRRRGHDTFSWTLLFLFLGPLAIPLAVSAERHPTPEPEGPFHPGNLDVLVAHDGSPQASSALDSVVELLGRRITSLTLATVVDSEAPTTVQGKQTLAEAHDKLQFVVDRMSATLSAPVDSVVLHGEPAHTLEMYAKEHGYELIVAGSTGSGRAHIIAGSVAKRLTKGMAVPVLIGPAVA